MSTESTRPEPPVTSPSVIVLTLARRLEAELNAALAPLDLTVARLALLGHVASLPGASFSELARMGGVTVQSVHTGIRALQSAGLVRDLTARAGSASEIELTPRGSDLLDRAREVIGAVDEKMFGPEAEPVPREIARTIRGAFPGDG
ncbi:MarR family transcriptional regulator [Nocardiopsis sp. CNR-923]|uniref:MarR family winged helix-turn-helix transcriptional regulator n=1 Tax=Nocardiopsis sp. CNR-923 TaxID=1904965 RepID=UPI000967AD68|nr:MarR family winged helix-turn-helix transcriptional regulator [Nocardiopsis sp. CNR-923]OLT27692.1 MarR family transcriptional regulator [Nocardiopsis sp. CNR-923]